MTEPRCAARANERVNPRDFELQQKKTRLRLRSIQQRRQFAQDAKAVLPAFAAAENVRSGWHWVREHPALVAGTAATLLVARPKVILRWARRGWMTWIAWRQLSDAHKPQSQRNPLKLIGLVSTLFSK